MAERPGEAVPLLSNRLRRCAAHTARSLHPCCNPRMQLPAWTRATSRRPRPCAKPCVRLHACRPHTAPPAQLLQPQPCLILNVGDVSARIGSFRPLRNILTALIQRLVRMEMIHCLSREEVWGMCIARSASDAPSPREPDAFRSLCAADTAPGPSVAPPHLALKNTVRKSAQTSHTQSAPPRSPSSPDLTAQTPPSVLRQDSLGVAHTW